MFFSLSPVTHTVLAKLSSSVSIFSSLTRYLGDYTRACALNPKITDEGIFLGLTAREADVIKRALQVEHALVNSSNHQD